MKRRDQHRSAYNAPAGADAQEGIRVAGATTRHENDGGQRAPMMEQARENLGVAAPATLTVADPGYGAGADRAAAAEKEMTVLVPPAAGPPARDHPCAAQHFGCAASPHTVTWPRGQQLAHEGATTQKGRRAGRCRCHCRDCPVRGDCPRDPQGRQLEVGPPTPVVQAMRARRREPATQPLRRRRQEIIARCFAQFKQHAGFRRWTAGGLDHVRTPWARLGTTLNRRVSHRRWRAGRGPQVTAAAAALKMMAGGVKPVRAGAGEVLRRARTGRLAPNASSAGRCFWPPTPSALPLIKNF